MATRPNALIAEVFNLEGRGKVIVYRDYPDDAPVIKMGDEIEISSSGQCQRAFVNGIEIIEHIDPKASKRGMGGLLITWKDGELSDECLRDAVFTKV